MCYRDDFYKASNIIGYTGDYSNPDHVTVYFQSGEEFGRITQYYPENEANVGRSVVRSCKDYKIYNEHNDQNDYHAIEFYDKKVRHTSRNPFVALDGKEHLRLELAQAISRHKYLKFKYE